MSRACLGKPPFLNSTQHVVREAALSQTVLDTYLTVSRHCVLCVHLSLSRSCRLHLRLGVLAVKTFACLFLIGISSFAKTSSGQGCKAKTNQVLCVWYGG
eukprot:COSAG06_NODE_137_length_22365_cov_49.346313_2_plen_100_part_00